MLRRSQIQRGRKSIRALSLCDICGSNLSLHLTQSCLIPELLMPWYFADMTNERLEETYELRENIDSINGVSALVICGTRTDGNSTLHQQSENGIWNVKILISPFLTGKYCVHWYKDYIKAPLWLWLCDILKFFHRSLKTTSLSNEHMMCLKSMGP